MSLKYGKASVKVMEAALEAPHETLGDAAEAAILASEAIFEDRAKFVVVGQLASTKERSAIPPDDPEAIRLSLGWYSTEGDARAASETLWHNAATGDTFRTWVLPVFHGTPAELHKKRKDAYQAQAEKAAEAVRLRLQGAIEKRLLEAEIRNAGGKGSCSTCKHQAYDHRTAGSSRGVCGLDECPCPKWAEKKK